MDLNSSVDHRLDHSYLYNELAKGREHVKRLQIDLNVPASSNDTRELLTNKILNSYDEALSILTECGVKKNNINGLSQHAGMAIRRSESPCPLSGNPHDEGCESELKDSNHKDAPRKKNRSSSRMDKWKQRVKVSPETGFEAVPPDDGYIWRKYGQKEILHAKYPRGYYRCTYRDIHGCDATKQVQRSSDDPSIFEVTYLGKHTCPKNLRASNSSTATDSASGVLNFSIQTEPTPKLIDFSTAAESASRILRISNSSTTTESTSTITRSSFEFSDKPRDRK